MGYVNAVSAPMRLSLSSNDFIQDDVKCLGHETNLLDCPSLINSHNCGTSEGAGVVCSTNRIEDGQYQLDNNLFSY